MAYVLTTLKVVPIAQTGEAAALASELGLDLQAKRYEKQLAEKVFTPLTEDELVVWEHYCPTKYVPGGGENIKALESYAFDNIPIEVMRHWKAIKDNYAFDRYEIWTTERRPQAADPILIGIIGLKMYLLARWGLESPDSMPLEAVAKAVAEGLWKTRYRRKVCYGFMYLKSRETGDLHYSDSDREFKAACRVAGWRPAIRRGAEERQ